MLTSSPAKRAPEPSNRFLLSTPRSARVTSSSTTTTAVLNPSARRSSGPLPCPRVRRSLIARAISCSNGRNTPGPSVYAIEYSTDRPANAAGCTACALIDRKP